MAADKRTLLRDALKQVQGGKIDKAIETYRAIIKADPRDATVHNTLGDLYIKQGRKKDAIGEYLEASALYEKDGFALRAIAVCQKVVNADPDQLAVLLKLGDLYASQRLPAEARTHYLKVADVYDRKKDVSGALDIFRKIANLDPDNLPVRVKLAGMFEKQKFPDKAAEEYVRAAKGYLDKKEVDSAVQLFVRAFKLSPANLEARRRLADYYAQRQDWPVVIGLLETPAVKGSTDLDLLVLYAEALTRVNHPQDAIKVLGPAQEREPNSVPVNLVLGRAWLKAGEAEKGTAALNRCVSVHLAENKLELAESLLGEMAAAAPDDDKIFQRILEVAQKRADKGAVAKAYLQLTSVYERKGLVRNATGALEKYLELNPGDTASAARLESLKAETPPKVEAPPPPAPAPPAASAPVSTASASAPAPAAEEEVVEIDLEGEDLTEVMAVGEEELVLEVEDEEAPAAEALLEPASVADALALVRQGASMRASAFLEEHLGRHPGDREAWLALVEARRHLNDRIGIRDAQLRLADLHRREARFEEAHAAYRAALDADPRSAAAARGLTELLLEEEAAAAPPVPPPPAQAPPAEEEISLDLLDESTEVVAAEPEPGPAVESAPELEPAALPGFAPEPESEPESVAEAEPLLDEFDLDEGPAVEAEPMPRPEREQEPIPEAMPEPEPAPYLEPEPRREFEPEPESAPVSVAMPVEEAPPAPVEAAATEQAAVDASEQFWGFEDLLDSPPAPGAAPTATGPQPLAEPEPAPEPEEFNLEAFGDDTLGLAAPAAAATPPAPASQPPVQAAPAPSLGQEFEEFLAEADFYFQQGLVDEAEFLYKKLLQISPGHPDVTRQLHKLEESRAPAPAAAAADLDGLDRQLDMAFGGDFGEAPADAPPAAVPEPAFPGVGPSPDSRAADFSDFLDGLRQELTAQEPPSPPAPLQGDEGLADIFQEFQRSVKEQLGDEDFETHYNLGIAYKEMGLMDEAVAEFTLAEKSPVRRLNAVSMIALCLREVGRFDEAALKLRTGISLATEGSEEQKGFLYDLAALHEQAGRAADAQEALQRLLAIDPGYRDVASRLRPAPASAPAPGAPPRKKPKVSYL